MTRRTDNEERGCDEIGSLLRGFVPSVCGYVSVAMHKQAFEG